VNEADGNDASGAKGGGSNPSQAVRLLWFFLFFLPPMGAVTYVSTYGLEHGDEEALIRVFDARCFASRDSLLRNCATNPDHRRNRNDERGARQPMPCRR
jgi:hypothetical protein